MLSRARSGRPRFLQRAALRLGALLLGAVPLAVASAQQQEAQTGSIAGRVTSDAGAPLENVQVFVEGLNTGAVTRATGEYIIVRVPAGTHTVRARLIGHRSEAASVTVTPGGRATQDFTLARDPLALSGVVVTGTAAPQRNLEAPVAITTLTPQVVQQAQPRSTTEMLRYVPGFTRVESSGGEVNQNISMRGILGVEYVMFMEDGLPVFPTMHTFFMNADNLFRPDENIDRMEVVRGGSSALYGSNTPGAIINFINKTGGTEFGGTTRFQGGSNGLARYDLDLGGPLGDAWRFNVGGFYRYDRGVRYPGFPGIKGGQIKGNLTRLLPNGYLRFSAKIISDQNQFILDLPFENPKDPRFVPGFGDYGSFNTNQGLDLRVPTPDGSLTLPLGQGLNTNAGWLTADFQFDVGGGFTLQNTGQVMRNQQGWNAIVPSNALTAADFITAAPSVGGLGLPAGTTFQYTYTNQFDATGKPLPFNTANGLVAPSGEWHINKPLSAFQDQLQLRKSFGGQNTVAAGVYFANYTQGNQWYFTDILMDVRDNPNFLDLTVTPPGGTPRAITKNGFRHYVSNYVNGAGTATIVSGVLGGDFKLTDKLRASIGGRLEWNDFVQSSENTSSVDLDGDTTTAFDNETWGNHSFRHFTNNLNDWAASLGLNYAITPTTAVYVAGSRGYKMPALDEFLNATAQAQVNLFGSREVHSVEGGVKYAAGPLGFTVNGFYTLLKNIVSQGAVVDTTTGRTTWIVVTSPENRAYGAEGEVVVSPIQALQLRGNATWLRAELGSGAGSDIGSRINGVPASIANLAATYTLTGVQLLADWHFVAKRFTDVVTGANLPSYNYFNFGASYRLPGNQAVFDVGLLNAFQSKGLEEGNPRLVLGSTSSIFLARPLLPRRLTAGVRYNF